jgi:hypothetical protein
MRPFLRDLANVERTARCLVGVALLFGAVACTDFEAQGGQANTQTLLSGTGESAGVAGADAGPADVNDPFVPVDTWSPPGTTDAGRSQPEASGTETSGGGPSDRFPGDAAPSDGGPPDAVAGDVDFKDIGPPSDAGPQDSSLSDSSLPDTAPADTSSPDAGAPELPPVKDTNSCAGRCGVYIAGAACQCDKGCSAFGDCCGDFVQLCAVPDAGAPDSGPTDAGASDAGPFDSGPADTAPADTAPTDTAPADTAPADTAPADTALADTAPADTAPADTAPADTALADTALADTAPADTGAGSGDSAWHPDWGGFPDASFPDGTDIFGGVMKSCKLLYFSVFDENCKGADLSAACIDKEAKIGSQHAQFLFAPLKDCVKVNCVPKCKGSSNTGECIQQCLGKRCAYPFFACLTEGEGGKNDCPTTLACLESPEYKDKIFKIATHCFGNAQHLAQKQVADFFACSQAPQTSACFSQIQKCYDNKNATTSCNKTIQCFEKCEKDNKGEPCTFGCIGSADAEAVKLLDAVQQCQLDNCNDCNGPKGCADTCTEKWCKNEWLACSVD